MRVSGAAPFAFKGAGFDLAFFLFDFRLPRPWPRTERKVRRNWPVLDRVLYRAQLSQTALIP